MAAVKIEREDASMSAKKKKTSWFEAWCTMDETPTPRTRKSTQSNQKGKQQSSRARVRNLAADPYGEDDIPPFEGKSASAAPKGSNGRSSGGRKTVSTADKTKGKSGRSSTAHSTSAKGTDKPLPAEIAYRMQPYLVLGVGVLIAIMLVISAAMSGGEFGWSAQTHPFRWVGYHVERLFFGLIGYGAYLLPAAMIYLAAVRIREGKDDRSNGRGLLACAILVLFPAMIHTCMIDAGRADGALATWSIKELYVLGADKLGGGVLGGLLGRLCHVGLGVIGTMIVGGLLMVVLVLLLLRLTPRAIWQAIRRAMDARAERVSEYREREAKRAEERALLSAAQQEEAPSPRRTKSRQLQIEEPAIDVTPVASEEDDDDIPALKPARRKKRGDEESEDDFNPMNALLEKNEKKESLSKPNNEPYGGDPSTVFPDELTSYPIEHVSELSREEIEAMERTFASSASSASFASSSVAHTVDPADEGDEVAADEKPVFYPDRVEIDMEANTVSPLEEPIEQRGEAQFDELADVQDGFDYSMESTENADVVEGTEIIGGVEIAVERLSQEERERGELIAKEREDVPVRKPYVYPTVDLLNAPKPHSMAKDQEIRAKMHKLHETLKNFKVNVEGISYVCGPSVTRYEVRPAPGVRVRSIANLADDIAMSLAAKSIRIEAPIPGKEAVGIEVPNATRETVFLRRLIDSDDFRNRPSRLTASLGEDVAGNPIVIDLVKMPHLLVAGTTGSGKSVCINDFIMSLVYKASPDEVKIILIDPKQVEFTMYKDLPHLMAPIVCEPKRAAAALNLAVLEMEKRFQMIREVGVRDIAGYNAITENDRYEHPYMPQIVIIIDELADLMMQARDEVEGSIVRIAQKARAAGMHLVIGTQRPSVDVITGLIKANVPSRIACTVVSQVDSRTILDIAGAEKLLGMGDMLYAPVGSPKPLRVQGAFVSDKEVEAVVEFVKKNNDPVRYDQEFLDNLDREAQMIGQKRTADMDDDMEGDGADGHDPKFYEALRVAVDNNRISTSLLQRMLSIGYGRAAKIIDDMERLGYVSPAVGNKPREIRLTKEAYAELIMNKED